MGTSLHGWKVRARVDVMVRQIVRVRISISLLGSLCMCATGQCLKHLEQRQG